MTAGEGPLSQEAWQALLRWVEEKEPRERPPFRLERRVLDERLGKRAPSGDHSERRGP